MELILHKNYPSEIKNRNGMIFAVKLIPSGFPNQGPGPVPNGLPSVAYPGILLACNTWTNGPHPDLMHWDWWAPIDKEHTKELEDFIRAQALPLNQWHYIDTFDKE